MQFTNSGPTPYGRIDRFNDDNFIAPILSDDEQAVTDALSLGTAELGSTTNPMGNTLQSLKSRIMEGVGKLEFEFIGKGKGNSQSPTPESFGTLERQDMKELVTLNDIKTSVHASVHTESLAGFGQNGFNDAQRRDAIREIQRAVDFAGDVTSGGAVVFHLSEWQRPMSEIGRNHPSDKSRMFLGYEKEEQDATMYVIDKRNGRVIEGLSRDTELFEPEFETAGQDHPEMVGKTDKHGVIIQANDWIDINGNVIPKTAGVKELFDRIPRWNKDETNFKIKKLTYDDFIHKTDEWNKNHSDKKTPEEMYAMTKLQNNILQAKGNSLYHAQRYEYHKTALEKFEKAYNFYKQLEAETPDDEKWRLRKQISRVYSDQMGVTIPDDMLPTEYLAEQIKEQKDNMRHIHESSASADAQAIEQMTLIKNLRSVENYGLEKTTDTIAQVGMHVMETTKRKKLENPLYAAPENYDQHTYGSHPDEMRTIVNKSREKMVEMLLRTKKANNKEEAQKLAKDHIKSTLDIGHMNMWRQYFDPKDKDGNPKYKTFEAREKAFNKWILDETEQLVKEGVVGHVHLTDNFGYGDEHLTPGQGNTPMKEFLKRMEKIGMKDMIVEPGSYNISTALPDTMKLAGSPIYSFGRGPRWSHVQQAHFGYNAPGFFIAGSYSPSNEWKPWTDVPLE